MFDCIAEVNGLALVGFLFRRISMRALPALTATTFAAPSQQVSIPGRSPSEYRSTHRAHYFRRAPILLTLVAQQVTEGRKFAPVAAVVEALVFWVR